MKCGLYANCTIEASGEKPMGSFYTVDATRRSVNGALFNTINFPNDRILIPPYYKNCALCIPLLRWVAALTILYSS